MIVYLLKTELYSMKLFATKQMAHLDRFTIENEPVEAVDLMERASLQAANWIKCHFSDIRGLIIFAGSGNNGGDALAMARQLAESGGYRCRVYLTVKENALNGSPKINWQRLKDQGKVELHILTDKNDFPVIDTGEIILDGLFGSGLTRPLHGFAADIVRKINSLPNTVISIDLPSGLMGEDNTGNNPETIIKSNFTLTFQFPKISFLFPENEIFTGKWITLPINLHPLGISSTPSDFYMTDNEYIRGVFCRRGKFSHKGTFGHALLIAGSYGKMGAAVLASRSCLRSGAGLLTTHIPKVGYTAVQTAVSEAMVSVDADTLLISQMPELYSYTAIGAGPGIGTNGPTAKVLYQLLTETKIPMVLDADALNILSENKAWLAHLPENTILTPHPGEFRRLAGEPVNSFQRLEMQKEFAQKYKVVVVLKGAYTSIALPDGKIFFNPTGNPGMATAGSGDVLTGIILGLLAQGLTPETAAIAGVYLHGLAGDIASELYSEPSMLAGDIVVCLGEAFKQIGNSK